MEQKIGEETSARGKTCRTGDDERHCAAGL
ncbi:Uncharacterised protein [Salmonella enterica subsp. enterica]|nr:Uncharacterised protein [Salmonella enterica subsp. enterica]